MLPVILKSNPRAFPTERRRAGDGDGAQDQKGQRGRAEGKGGRAGGEGGREGGKDGRDGGKGWREGMERRRKEKGQFICNPSLLSAVAGGMVFHDTPSPLRRAAKTYYAMLCYAMLCYAMLCYAMLCYAMLCYAIL